jgi:hopanoid C-3 methylase
MRVLLVMPTPFENGRLGLENVMWLSEPVALTAIGAAVGDRHEVRVLDMRLEEESKLAITLSEFAPDVVGTTSMTTDAYQAKAVLRMVRAMRPEALTVVGGHHPTLCPGEFDEPYVDVIVQGEGELTFREVVDRWTVQGPKGDRTFEGVRGVRFLNAGVRIAGAKREQTARLDDLPAPDRRLIARYEGRYFFTGVRPMASIFTSRGCSFDCNFCAIWEFYERRTRFLSAARIVDQLAACSEPFVFILDDNFLTSAKRATDLCEELERRGVHKYWMTQGRTDFAADHPELMERLARNGLVMVLSGYESNNDDNLAALRKKNTWAKNKQANEIMRDLGIFVTGIFMVRADWTAENFERLYEYVRTLSVAIPLFTVLTPLPGTQLHRAYRDKLLTTDMRLFDLLHAVLPTRLPRDEFYRQLCRGYDATESSVRSAFRTMVARRTRFVARVLPGMLWFYARTWRYQRIHYDYRSFLRDEEGLLDGPGAKNGLTWRDVEYPTGGDVDVRPTPESEGTLVSLRIPRRSWVDDLADARANAGAAE